MIATIFGRFRGDFLVYTEGLHHGQADPSGPSAPHSGKKYRLRLFDVSRPTIAYWSTQDDADSGHCTNNLSSEERKGKSQFKQKKNPVFSGIPRGADEQIRTADLLITNQLLYQLSYVGTGDPKTNFLRRAVDSRERDRTLPNEAPKNRFERQPPTTRIVKRSVVPAIEISGREIVHHRIRFVNEAERWSREPHASQMQRIVHAHDRRVARIEIRAHA